MASTQPVRWMAWHPHQKLWNWRLVRSLGRVPLGGVLVRLVIGIDSLLLAIRAPWRNIGRDLSTARVLYLDCGLHKEGRQVRAVSEWLGSRVRRLDIIGFEAGPDHVDDARRGLADVPNLHIHHVALVGPDHTAPTVRLYRDGANGRGDSLFAERGTAYDDVPAVRLSSYLPADGNYDAIILRMNIEGSESLVIDDLIDAGATSRVTAYYGMWDDLSKIDADADCRFRRVLAKHAITTVTFNDRDFALRLRLWAIRRHLLSGVRVS